MLGRGSADRPPSRNSAAADRPPQPPGTSATTDLHDPIPRCPAFPISRRVRRRKPINPSFPPYLGSVLPARVGRAVRAAPSGTAPINGARKAPSVITLKVASA